MSEWKDVASLADFSHTDRKLVDLGGNHQIGIFQVGEEFFAVSAWCSHQKATIMSGDVEGHEIECPLHAARFDLRTGRHLCLPAVRPIASYPLKREGDRILVQIKE
ncbi:MAG TPA: non-heme iron oxygenase ferredoxin subunit [Kiritimatiellia bacterium]|nr:non-heme iron oxygenase ferredoxin subunit [Kiritimatiellia bacterium]